MEKDTDTLVSEWVSRTLRMLEIEAGEEQERSTSGKWVGEIADAEHRLGSVLLRCEGTKKGGARGVVTAGAPAALRVSEAEEDGKAQTDKQIPIHGTVASVTDSSIVMSVDSSDWNHDWLGRRVRITPVPSDVTYKAIRFALRGGGMGFGRGPRDWPPLLGWRGLPPDNQRLVRLAFGGVEQDGPPPPPPAAPTEEAGGEEDNDADEGIDDVYEVEEVEGEGDEGPISWHVALNPSQQEAVLASLDASPVHLILGPPGTGKTTTVCEMIRQAVSRKRWRVLVVTPSNVAADNIVATLATPKLKGLRCLRVGYSGRLPEHIAPFSLDAKMASSESEGLAADIKKEMAKVQKELAGTRGGARKALWGELRQLTRDLRQRERRVVGEVMGKATVVVGTLVNSAAYYLRNVRHFDLVVVDEACQALEPLTWVALTRAPRCVLAGDPYQLPPTVLSNQPELSVTLFERLQDRVPCTMLDTQYRMHREIAEWSSDHFYDSRLKSDEAVAEHLLCHLTGVKTTDATECPLLLLDTSTLGCEEVATPSGAISNPGEGDVVVSYLSHLVAAGVPQEAIAVIAPYAGQVALLKDKAREFDRVEIGTVDGFQGREKEAIVLSMTRSNSEGIVGFLSDTRRTNVAITRARRQLAMIGDTVTLRRDPFLDDLVSYLEGNGMVYPAEDFDP
eukprot:Sspe_Gene.89912::Locus_61580_Transcript_1_1_Confidence_1.000_Length_2083::g.89912::m.89912/K19036/IGHMBP2; ATP-dependent RNA/DNA helicase IGHMBP2